MAFNNGLENPLKYQSCFQSNRQFSLSIFFFNEEVLKIISCWFMI